MNSTHSLPNSGNPAGLSLDVCARTAMARNLENRAKLVNERFQSTALYWERITRLETWMH
jgi:hypothetical protein